MKLRVLSAAAAVLLLALVAAHGAPEREMGSRRARPVLARLGEEYFIRVGNRERDLEPRRWLRRAVQLQLEGNVGADSYEQAQEQLQQQRQQRPGLQEREERQQEEEEQRLQEQQEEEEKRARRSEEPPISLDLTFHLLREVLEMARAEQLAQQAHSNRKMMEIFGK
ncbi:corticotropin releasing hormone b [Astyanax mexicanus]|uniref:corticotropin releasing hormone b n=1 Tax=Astyanax mexicanus TaxID=7994 RepID=UPI0003CD37E0|nr:corticotropin releasing hormone b [Astyanax mexicanus]